MRNVRVAGSVTRSFEVEARGEGDQVVADYGFLDFG